MAQQPVCFGWQQHRRHAQLPVLCARTPAVTRMLLQTTAASAAVAAAALPARPARCCCLTRALGQRGARAASRPPAALQCGCWLPALVGCWRLAMMLAGCWCGTWMHWAVAATPRPPPASQATRWDCAAANMPAGHTRAAMPACQQRYCPDTACCCCTRLACRARSPGWRGAVRRTTCSSAAGATAGCAAPTGAHTRCARACCS